jgi:hypothetical protein
MSKIASQMFALLDVGLLQRAVCVLTLAVLVPQRLTHAADGSNDEPARTTESDAATSDVVDIAFEPYCGVHSLYSALHMLGKSDVELRQLVTKRYVDTREGSTLTALVQAARDFGLHAFPLQRMSTHALRNVRCPVILHVRHGLEDREYKHWILFAGVENGKARSVDGNQPIRLIGFDELAAR